MKIYCPPVEKQSVLSSLLSQSRKLKQHTRCLSFVTVPVVRGPLRGKRWTLSSRGKLLRILFGTYEQKQTELLANRLRPGNIFFDIGANVGYYSLLSAKIVGRWGQVFAFEPVPENAYYLQKHIELNRFKNIEIFNCALGEVSRKAGFTADTGSGTGYLCEQGGIEVSMRSLDDIVEEQGVLPTHIKMDVEGSELKVLRGAQRTFQRARPALFLSTHGREVKQSCLAYLASLSYLVKKIDGGSLDTSDELFCYPRELQLSPRRMVV